MDKLTRRALLKEASEAAKEILVLTETLETYTEIWEATESESPEELQAYKTTTLLEYTIEDLQDRIAEIYEMIEG